VSLVYLFRFAPGALLMQLRQMLIFAAAAARASTPTRPPFWGEVKIKKNRLERRRWRLCTFASAWARSDFYLRLS
jgi:hypothetical protein